jgi:hypothetical protein
MSLLADCEAARDDPVVFSRQPDDTVLVQWKHNNVPLLRTAKQPESDHDFPAPPATWHELPENFLPALCDVLATVEREAIRYATHCVQLCGRTGRIMATDSRQALVVSGFEFPWDDQLLLPWNGVFDLKELSGHGTLRIGRRDNRLSLATGPWTLHFALETERRFPRIDDCIPAPGSAKTTLTISDDDAKFAAAALKDLPKDDFDNTATVDLNGAVAFRTRAGGPATELVLSNSVRSGEATCFVSDRDILRRALLLGFREFRLIDPDKVISSEDGNRTFLWMPLAPPDPVQAGPDTVRLESPVGDAASPSAWPSPSPVTPTPRRQPRTMAKTRIPENGQPGANGQDNNSNNGFNGVDALIDQAEGLKNTLRDSLTGVGDLISGLKQHRQQTKKFRSAVMTLKQLQALDA